MKIVSKTHFVKWEKPRDITGKNKRYSICLAKYIGRNDFGDTKSHHKKLGFLYQQQIEWLLACGTEHRPEVFMNSDARMDTVV